MIPFKQYTNSKKSIYLFDMDETIFTYDHDALKIHVLDSQGNKVDSLTNAEFNSHKLPKGHNYDFSDFRSSDVFVKEAKPIRKMLAKMKAIFKNGQRVEILFEYLCFVLEYWDVRGHEVIITDDGMATGSTMLSAIRSIRTAGASKVLVAVPVAPPEAHSSVLHSAETLICPFVEADFQGVGQFYISFPQLSDDQVKVIFQAVPTVNEN